MKNLMFFFLTSLLLGSCCYEDLQEITLPTNYNTPVTVVSCVGMYHFGQFYECKAVIPSSDTIVILVEGKKVLNNKMPFSGFVNSEPVSSGLNHNYIFCDKKELSQSETGNKSMCDEKFAKETPVQIVSLAPFYENGKEGEYLCNAVTFSGDTVLALVTSSIYLNNTKPFSGFIGNVQDIEYHYYYFQL